MPITPLHFGLMAPVNHYFKGKVSSVSFVLANIWMDGEAIKAWAFNLPFYEHPPSSHSFLAALVMGAILAVPGFRSRKWVIGAFFGTFSHVLLDMLVHTDMDPFYPEKGNPAYMGWMEPLSWVLAPLLIWFIAQCVSGSLGWVRRRRAAAQAPTEVTGL